MQPVTNEKIFNVLHEKLPGSHNFRITRMVPPFFLGWRHPQVATTGASCVSGLAPDAHSCLRRASANATPLRADEKRRRPEQAFFFGIPFGRKLEI